MQMSVAAAESELLSPDYSRLVYEAEPAQKQLPDSPSVCLDPNQRWAVVADNEKTVFTLEVSSGELAVVKQEAVRLPDFGRAVFSPDGQHLYTVGHDLHVLRAGNWEMIETIRHDKINFEQIAITQDGRSILTLSTASPSTLTTFSRDIETGQLTKTQVVQPDQESLRAIELAYQRLGKPIPLIDGATHVPRLQGARAILFSPDSKWAFVTGDVVSLIAFRRSLKSGKLDYAFHLSEPNAKPRRYGFSFPTCLAYRQDERAQANDLIVAGVNSLVWLNWDAMRDELTPYKFWLDDSESERLAAWNRPYLSCLDRCHVATFSKNGRYLFLASTEESSPSVLELDNGDLKYLGNVPAGPKPENGIVPRVLNVVVSPDGKYLFSQYSHCRLKVHELDERFWK
jgi:WD40 repeat protein